MYRVNLVCISTFFSLSAADPERIASSIAALAKAGFIGVLALGSITVLGLPCGKIGGGGGANVGAGSSGGGGGGGGGVKTGGKVEVKEEGAGKDADSAHLSTSEAAFLNFSSSTAASDLVCRKQRSETMSTVVTSTRGLMFR